MTLERAPAWLVATVLTLVVGAAATSAPARAQDACDGVGVVVDATALGGSVTSRCAPGDPSSGLEALQGAGHSYTFVPRQPGLVCTIDARPDPCNGAPQDAYWSYWHAPAGGEWTYSTRGAGNRDPEPGTVEGWAFGAGDPPRQPPPAAEPEPDPPPADDGPTEESAPARSEQPATTDADGAGPSQEDPTADEAGDEPEPTQPGPTEPGTTEPTVTDLPLPSPTGSPTELDDPPGPVDPSTVSPAPAPVAGDVRTGGGGGAPVGLLAGGVLVVGLAGTALLRARRRDDG
ncbi:MAG: hypothetical protein KY457_07500 [Actinobacteria bacterium]|nr:hypothetical protein [Actinomycetota bacterium]